MLPSDLNSKYTVFGGLVMGLCDRTALIVAERRSGSVCVTAAVDSLGSLAPARAGDTPTIEAGDAAGNVGTSAGVVTTI